MYKNKMDRFLTRRKRKTNSLSNPKHEGTPSETNCVAYFLFFIFLAEVHCDCSFAQWKLMRNICEQKQAASAPLLVIFLFILIALLLI